MLFIKEPIGSVIKSLLNHQRNIPRTILYIGYVVLWNIYSLLESLKLLLFAKRTHSRQYPTVIQRKIQFRMKIFTLDLPSPSDFLASHPKQVDSSYILRDDVTLYCICGDVAVFVQTPAHIDVHDTEAHPFVQEAQYRNAIYTITMPIEVAHKVAEEIGDPKKTVLYLSHTGRCGSTLLGQIMHKTGEVKVLSCASSIRCLYTSHKTLSEAVKGRIALTIMKLALKPGKYESKQSVVFWKGFSFDVAILPLMIKYVPWLVHICLYRRGVETVRSFESLYYGPDSKILKYKLLQKVHFYLWHDTWDLSDYSGNIDTPFMATCWRYASTMTKLIKYTKLFNIQAFRFEDLVQNPEETITKIFNTCRIPDYLVKVGQRAMDTHSQKNSFLEKKSRMKSITMYKDEDKARADSLCADLGLPNLDVYIHI